MSWLKHVLKPTANTPNAHNEHPILVTDLVRTLDRQRRRNRQPRRSLHHRIGGSGLKHLDLDAFEKRAESMGHDFDALKERQSSQELSRSEEDDLRIAADKLSAEAERMKAVLGDVRKKYGALSKTIVGTPSGEKSIRKALSQGGTSRPEASSNPSAPTWT